MQETDSPRRRASVALDIATKALVYGSAATLAVTAGFAIWEEMKDNTESYSEGDAVTLELAPAYDLRIVQDFPEYVAGHSRDDKGIFGTSEPWTDIFGIVLKDILYKPPYPIRTDIREDATGRFLYVYMQDDSGQEVPLTFEKLAISPRGMQDCTERGAEDGMQAVTFPDCPLPDSPQWRGAKSTRAYDGTFFWNNEIMEGAGAMADVIIQGDYCINRLMGSAYLPGTTWEEVLNETPNPEAAYSRWSDAVWASIKRQLGDGYRIPLFNQYGLPTVRFMEQQAAITRIIQEEGVTIFTDPDRANDRLGLYMGDMGADPDAPRPAMDLGPSYAEQMLDLEPKHINVAINPGSSEYVNRDNPVASWVNVAPCRVALYSEEQSQAFLDQIVANENAAGLFGDNLKMPDGSLMTAVELDARFDAILGNEPQSTTATTVAREPAG